MEEVQVYEELWQDCVAYEQVEGNSRMCHGCAFHDTDGICHGISSASAICSVNDTIWIKKEQPAKEAPMKDIQDTPKAGTKHDQEKERYDLIPVLALEEVAKVLTAGAAKYNEDYNEENWRKVPNAQRRYFSATQRHLAWVRKGQTHDSETGLHHYAHAITNLMFLLEKELELEGKAHVEPQMDWDAC